MVSIRPAVPTDAEAIATVHVLGWQVGYAGLLPDAHLRGLSVASRRQHWHATLSDPGRQGDVLVAVEQDRIIGFARTGPSRDGDAGPGVAELYACYVHPNHWSRGVGRALCAAARAALRDAGYTTATLWVLETNQRARRFYRLVGWQPDGATRTDSTGNDIPLPEIRMTTDLQNPTQPREC